MLGCATKSRGSKVRLKSADRLLKGKIPYVSLGKVPYGYPVICSIWLYKYPIWVLQGTRRCPRVPLCALGTICTIQYLWGYMWAHLDHI